jgi:hypothetical protein
MEGACARFRKCQRKHPQRQRLWRRSDQGPQGPRCRAQAARHVHRRYRRWIGPAPHGVRGFRQRHRRGAGRALRSGADRAEPRRLGFGRGQRARHSHRHPRRGRRFRRRSDHDPAARGRKVREHQRRQRLQGVGRPSRRRRLGGQRPVGMAGTDDLARRQGTLDALRARRRGRPAGGEAALRPAGKKGTRVTFLAFDRNLQERHSNSISRSWSTATANWPSSIRACASCCATSAARGKEHDLFYEGGIARVRDLPRSQQGRCCPIRSPFQRNATASASTSRWNGTTATTKTSCASPTTSRSAMAAPTLPHSARR